MKPDRFLVTAALAGILAACATPDPTPTEPTAGQAVSHRQLQLKLRSGVYRCELGHSVEVERDPRDVARIQLGWRGKRYGMQRFDSSSGLPRFEDRRNGLVWIDLPWKSVLLDSASGQPLANECRMS